MVDGLAGDENVHVGTTHEAPELIGRTSELDALQSFLDTLAGGRAALVLDGEAGIGKTALLTTGIGLATERGTAPTQAFRFVSSLPTLDG